ncbi:short-chain dehydrogenase [Hypericibacter terrae]|jgi:NAD(P)-dependent dehydrogenase (short-subunit alcohol dehydrogenase family)|uniref:Short-chain dehydrogenase n=1 Tax=Hypericibacter terrae TaxID=2602015 RepID=A0A5J6MPX4_9PROT|nr:SDR family NAD(P)-dependent oxidoreductase [Hypericibacter terrae]QEX19692.1 short-chain dehydrogenase [Hypericibacter terrae]
MAKNDVVMITGATGNLGRAAASAFARQGARLCMVARELGDLGVYKKEGAADVLACPADLLDATSVDKAVAKAIERFGQIDVLCNIAGGFAMGEAVHEIDAKGWAHMMELNAGSVLRMSHAVVPGMLARKSGKIVNIGAYAALGGKAQMGAYIASKSAVIRLTESMAAELRDAGINVNCVLPSIIDTPENRQAMPKANPAKWVAPEALADAILFLASPAARAIHGAALPVVGLS